MTKNNYVIAGLILVVFLLICFLNRLYPLYSDDWLYAFIYNTQERISCFYDIIISQQEHYLQWGGRSVVHAIAQFLIWIGEPWNDVLNSIVFVLFIFLVYQFSVKGKAQSIKVFFLLFLLCWTFLPTVVTTILWLTGSANYLWGTVIVLLFLYPFYLYYKEPIQRKGVMCIPLFFLLGIISGWTLENLFVAQLVFILFLMALLKRENRDIPKWMYFGLIGVFIGGVSMLLAPGNFIRSEYVNESLGLADESMMYNIGYRVLKVAYRYVVYVLPLTVAYAVVFLVRKKNNGSNWKTDKIVLSSFLFFMSAHIACFSMIATPIFPPRAAFGIITFMIIALGIIYANTEIKKGLYRRIDYIFIAILSLYFLGTYCYDLKNIQQMNTIFKEREHAIETSKRKGKVDVVFYDSFSLPFRYDFVDLSSDSTFWLNRQYQDYFEIKSVRVINQKK